MRQVLGVRERFGADHTINLNEYPTSEARLERVMQLTGGKGVDLAVEVVGRPEVVAEGLEMLCPGGTYLTMGLVTGGLISNLDLEKVVHKGGSRSSVRATTRHGFYPRCSTCWSELVISPFDKLVSHKFKLEDVNEGIQLSIEGKVIRAGVVPG